MASYVRINDTFDAPLDTSVWYSYGASTSGGQLRLVSDGNIANKPAIQTTEAYQSTATGYDFVIETRVTLYTTLEFTPTRPADFRFGIYRYDEDGGLWEAGVIAYTYSGSGASTVYRMSTYTIDPSLNITYGAELGTFNRGTAMSFKVGRSSTGAIWMESSTDGVSYAPMREITGDYLGSSVGLGAYAMHARFDANGPATDGRLDYLKVSMHPVPVTPDSATHSIASTSIGSIVPIPESTPLLGYSGGIGGAGFGRGFAGALLPGIQNIDLISSDALHAHAAQVISLIQHQNLAINSNAHSHTATAVSLTQVHNLSVASSSIGTSATSPLPVLAVLLGTNSTAHSLTTTSPLLVSEFIVPLHSSSVGVTSTTIELVQAHSILVDSASSGHTVDNIVAAEGRTLVIQSASSTTAATSVSVSQVHNLGIAETAHSILTDAIALGQQSILTVSDGNVSITTSGIDIEQFTLLGIPDAATHMLLVGEIPLSQAQNLLINGSLHSQGPSTLDIIDWTKLGVGFGAYIKDYTNLGQLTEAQTDSGTYRSKYAKSGTLNNQPENVASGAYIQKYKDIGRL